MADTIRVAIIDNFPIFVGGLQNAFREREDIQLVAVGSTAQDAVRVAHDEAPDIMLLDITVPGDGLHAAKAITAADLNVKIIVLTDSMGEDAVHACLAAGVLGYVLKGAGLDELIEAIRAVQNGEPFITRSLASRMLVSTSWQPVPGKALSPRERQIIELAATGMSNEEIAEHFGLALPTVKNCMSRILDKLKVRNRTEAATAWLKIKGDQA